MFKAWQIFLFSLIPLALVFAGVIGSAFRGVDSAAEDVPTPVAAPSSWLPGDAPAPAPATSEAAASRRQLGGPVRASVEGGAYSGASRSFGAASPPPPPRSL